LPDHQWTIRVPIGKLHSERVIPVKRKVRGDWPVNYEKKPRVSFTILILLFVMLSSYQPATNSSRGRTKAFFYRTACLCCAERGGACSPSDRELRFRLTAAPPASDPTRSAQAARIAAAESRTRQGQAPSSLEWKESRSPRVDTPARVGPFG
jgi:hypothetical protein